jgi:hypothetical protein
MNATALEKGVVLASLALTGSFAGYMMFKPAGVTKEKSADVRARLHREGATRMLYSTMSFFYLDPFQQEDAQSFRRMKEILDLGAPQLVALQLSEKEYN